MKTKILITVIHILLSVAFLQAQVVKTINVGTPGTLETLVGAEKTTITDLTLTGTINVTDFTTMKQMTALKDLNLRDVNITDGRIPDKAFEYRGLYNIILPRTLKSIGWRAFYFNNLQALDFRECFDLESIAHPGFVKLTQDNKMDFSSCLKLTSFVEAYGGGPFSGFTGEIILPPNLTTLSSGIFSGFKGEVHLPASIKTIGDKAFAGATLSKIDFTQWTELETIGWQAFNGFTITDVNNNKLDFSQNLKLKNFGYAHGSGPFYNFTGEVILPSNTTALPVGIFASFKGKVNLESLSIETIGNDAFYQSSLAESLILPSSLKTIGANAFASIKTSRLDFTRCSELETIYNRAFSGVQLLENTLDFSKCLKLVNFPSQHHYSTFHNCPAHVILPPNMTTIPTFSFNYFLGSVEIPQSVTLIDYAAFIDAIPSKEIILPSSLKTIGANAFERIKTSRLDFTRCPELETIYNRAFSGVQLQENTLDFSKCLKLVNFPSQHHYSTFYKCSAHVILPSNMTIIPNYTFHYFFGSVDFPSKLETISWNAFRDASLSKGLKLPSSLKTIVDEAFYNTTIPSIEFEGMSNTNLLCKPTTRSATMSAAQESEEDKK